MKQIRNDSEIDNQYSKIASIKTDYEAGIQSKVYIAKKHGISPVTLWRHANKGNWSYGRMREDVLESMSDTSKYTSKSLWILWNSLGRGWTTN